jgi:hypothetical protein
MFLNIIHRPVFIKKTQFFRDWILSPSSDEPPQLDPVDKASPYFRTTAPTQDI